MSSEIGGFSITSRPYREDRFRVNYNRSAYDLIKKIIAENGVRALKDPRTFWQIEEEELANNKKLKLYMEIAYDEAAIDKLIDAAKDDESTQSELVSELADEISAEYGIDEEFMEEVLTGVIEALSRANISVRGKNTCAQLKELRRLFASSNGIKYWEEDCKYEGPCEGTCPYCDAKTKELLEKAEELNRVRYPFVDIEEFEDVEEDDDEELVEGMMEEIDMDEEIWCCPLN